MKKQKDNLYKLFDWKLMLLPLLIVIVLAGLILVNPEHSEKIIGKINGFLGNSFGSFYILLGFSIFVLSLIIAFSKYGKIKLGEGKPVYSNGKWGAMIFTSTMAADILYWSLIEWAYYFDANPKGALSLSITERQLNASTYPLFHWGPIPWSFYILPAACYAYMFFIKKNSTQTLSEACRPVLGKAVDGFRGSAINITAITGLLLGTSTTFALVTPLLTSTINTIAGLNSGSILSITILIVIGIVFTLAVLFGMKAISKLADICVVLFAALALYVFIFGPTRFIIESGIASIGSLANNFFSLSTWTDPARLSGDGATGFPQQWTVFYWAYWIAWFVATPFFIAKISEGKTIRQMILGAFFFGLAGTFTSFTVFGNAGLFLQLQGNVDAAALLANGESPSIVIQLLLSKLPLYKPVLCLLVLAMIAFYASTFDAITLVVSGFCQKHLRKDELPHRGARCYWAFVFIILPIALIKAESALPLLQALSIIAAFPLAFIMLIIVAGFIKEIRRTKFSLNTDLPLDKGQR